MENRLKKLKKYLSSDAGIVIEPDGHRTKRKVIDCRFELIKQVVDSTEQKDDEFYIELIRLVSGYIDKLYDSEDYDFPKTVYDINGRLVLQKYYALSDEDIYKLRSANRDLSRKLFVYVCEILEQNKDIKLDIETLVKLLNRSPKRLEFAVGDNYLYRPFNFKRLVEIINRNELIKKSGISIDDIYQILIETCQINNEDIFVGLITPEDFKKDNKRVKELLKVCSAKIFVVITGIILRRFDKEFDVLAIAKQRTTEKNEELTPDEQRTNKNFFEDFISNLLMLPVYDKPHVFVHQLLNNPDVSIDYNFHFTDYSGEIYLTDLLAFSKDRDVTIDLLDRTTNIESCYCFCGYVMRRYSLYAIAGRYEEAIADFSENYDYAHDFNEDYSKGFNDEGYARADLGYEDSLVQFIIHICDSFEKDGIEYSKRKDIINRILNNKKVKHINIAEVLSKVKEVLSEEDFTKLLESLIEKYNSGSLEFITVDEEHGDHLFDRYNIRIASEDEIKQSLANLSGGSYTLKKVKPANPTGTTN